MNCPKCNSELLLDRVDSHGRRFYVCMNRRCPDFRQSFNPGSGEISESAMTTAKVITTDLEA